MTEIIVAIIAGVASIAGAYIATKSAMDKKSREDAIRDAQREQRQADRLDAIEKKLDIHNGYAEKLGAISVELTGIHKDIEYLREQHKK